MTDPIEERKAFMRYIQNAECELTIRTERGQYISRVIAYLGDEWVAMYTSGVFLVNNYAGYNILHHIYQQI